MSHLVVVGWREDALVSTAWDLSPEDALELPLDELALRVLEHYRDSGGWNWGNWMRARAEQYGSRSLALPALAEAWGIDSLPPPKPSRSALR